LHAQPAFASDRYPVGAFPVAERLSQEVLSLPMHTELTPEKLDYIIQSVRTFFES